MKNSPPRLAAAAMCMIWGLGLIVTPNFGGEGFGGLPSTMGEVYCIGSLLVLLGNRWGRWLLLSQVVLQVAGSFYKNVMIPIWAMQVKSQIPGSDPAAELQVMLRGIGLGLLPTLVVGAVVVTLLFVKLPGKLAGEDRR